MPRVSDESIQKRIDEINKRAGSKWFIAGRNDYWCIDTDEGRTNILAGATKPRLYEFLGIVILGMDTLWTKMEGLSASLTNEVGQKEDLETLLDTISYAVAPVTVIGEHSNMNSPWQNALDIITRIRTAFPVLRNMLNTSGLAGADIADDMLQEIDALIDMISPIVNEDGKK